MFSFEPSKGVIAGLGIESNTALARVAGLALAMNKKDVVMLFPGEGIGGRLYPRDLSAFLDEFYRKKGWMCREGYALLGLSRKELRTS